MSSEQNSITYCALEIRGLNFEINEIKAQIDSLTESNPGPYFEYNHDDPSKVSRQFGLWLRNYFPVYRDRVEVIAFGTIDVAYFEYSSTFHRYIHLHLFNPLLMTEELFTNPGQQLTVDQIIKVVRNGFANQKAKRAKRHPKSSPP